MSEELLSRGSLKPSIPVSISSFHINRELPCPVLHTKTKQRMTEKTPRERKERHKTHCSNRHTLIIVRIQYTTRIPCCATRRSIVSCTATLSPVSFSLASVFTVTHLFEREGKYQTGALVVQARSTNSPSAVTRSARGSRRRRSRETRVRIFILRRRFKLCVRQVEKKGVKRRS